MSAIDPKQAEQEELIAGWLRATPGFFERYADLFNEVRIKHLHEDRAISLQERQMTVLRTQNQELNRRLSEILHFGSRNDKINATKLGGVVIAFNESKQQGGRRRCNYFRIGKRL